VSCAYTATLRDFVFVWLYYYVRGNFSRTRLLPCPAPFTRPPDTRRPRGRNALNRLVSESAGDLRAVGACLDTVLGILRRMLQHPDESKSVVYTVPETPHHLIPTP
jgi:hypothetical protein